MATLARPGRPLTQRIQRAYRLEMAGRTVAMLLLLLSLTGLVIFYLGVITGKGLRDPNAPAVADSAPPASPAGEAPRSAPTALNHALQAPGNQIEGLKKEGDATNQQTQQLLSRAKQELALDEVTTKPAPASAPAAKSPTQPAASAPTSAARTATSAKPAPVAARPAPAAAPRSAAPEKSAATANGDGQYTVQVFSSPQQQGAQDVLTDLKKKGFPAYMNQFQAADKRTWYRVRVGKMSRQDAEALAGRIRQQANLHDLRVLKL
jgi:cell division septation protein DedD